MLTDDEDSEKEEEGEEEARDKIAKQIFDANDDDDTSAPVERETHSPKQIQEFGDFSVSEGEESGTCARILCANILFLSMGREERVGSVKRCK